MKQFLENLDDELKIKLRKQLSSYFTLMMTKISQTTMMCNTAEILNLSFDSGISVDSVMKAVHQFGSKVFQIKGISKDGFK